MVAGAREARHGRRADAVSAAVLPRRTGGRAPSFRLAALPAVHLASPMTAPPADWLHHLDDEADAAYLYRELARAEPDAA